MFRGIAKDELDIFWSEAITLLRPALERNGDYSALSLKRGLEKGDLKLWAGFGGETMDFAVITELGDYARRRVCLVLLMGGTLTEGWRGHLEAIHAWAKERGAQVMRLEGRDGWERVLPDYSRVSVVLERAL